MAAQVLIEIVPEVSKLESTLDQLQKKGAISDDGAAAYKAGNAELQKRNQLLGQEAAAESKADAAAKKHIPTLQDLQKSAGKMSATVLAQIQAIQKQTGTQQESTAATQTATAAVEKHEEAVVSLRTRQRELRDQIAQLIVEGKQESELFTQLTTEAGELDDAMNDANDAIRRTGSDTRNIDAVILGAQGIAAGFTVATSTAALFGEESEDTQKILLKVNAAMALLNGLQEIQNLLRSEYVKTLAASIKTQVVQNAQTAIDNGLTSTSIVVRTGAAVAQRVLNAAMAANPIGIVVVAVSALVTAMAAYISHTQKATIEQNKLNTAFQGATAGLEAELEAYNNFNRLRTADLERVGARQSEIMKTEIDNLRLQNQARVDEYNKLNAAITEAERKGTEITKEQYDARAKLAHDIDQANIDGKIKVTEYNKQLLEEQNNDAIAAAEAAIKLARNGSNAEIAAKANAAKVRRDIALKQLAQQQGDEKAIAAQRKAIEADYADTVEALANEVVDKTKAARQRRLAAEKAAVDNLLAVAREGSAEQLRLQEETIRKQAEIDKAAIETRNADPKVVAQERINIEQRANDEIRKARIAFADKQTKDAAAIELMLAQSRVAAFREGTAEYYDAQKAFLAQQADNQALDVQQSTDSEETKAAKIKLIYAQLNKDIAALQQQQFNETVARQRAEVDALQNLAQARLNIAANDPRLNDEQRFRAVQDARTEELRKIEADRARIEEDFQQGRIKSFEEYQAALTNNTAAAEQKRSEIVFAYLEKEKEMRKAIAQQAFDVASAFIQSEYAAEKAQRDADLQDALDKLASERDAAVSAKNLTEAQKAAIQKRYDAESKRLKTEAARKEREAQRRQIIANGIVAAAKTLAEYGFTPAAAIAIAGQAALTFLQLSELDRTPLPAYAKGTKSARQGYALVGEEGPELVRFKGGEQVYTATQSEKIMKEWNAADHSAVIDEYRLSHQSSSTEIDYEQLGKAVARHMPKAPQVHMVADKNGLTIFLQSESSKKIIRNQRYSTGQ